jgi:hypothetical protein
VVVDERGMFLFFFLFLPRGLGVRSILIVLQCLYIVRVEYF